MAIKYPDIDSIGWGDDVNDNFRELSQNDTDIKTAIGTEEMGTTATTLKGAIKEVKGITDNNTTQLNQNTQNIETLQSSKLDKTNYISKKTSLIMLNNWVNELGTFTASREGNTIFLNGDIMNGIETDNTIIAVLDEDYRPNETKIIPIISSGEDYVYVVGYLTLFTNGQLTIGGNGKNKRMIINANFTI